MAEVEHRTFPNLPCPSRHRSPVAVRSNSRQLPSMVLLNSLPAPLLLLRANEDVIAYMLFAPVLCRTSASVVLRKSANVKNFTAT